MARNRTIFGSRIKAIRVRKMQVEEITVEVTWKSIRNLYLRMGRDGNMRASVPSRTRIADVREFLQARLSWMRKIRSVAGSRGIPQLPKAEEGERIFLFGQAFLLHLQMAERPSLSLTDGKATLFVRTDSTAEERQAALKEQSRHLLAKQIENRLPIIEKTMGLHASGWHIRDMKSLWGSCNLSTKRICLNLRLVQRPPICLDAVIAHELVHTRIHGHGRDFYALLDECWPSWHEAEKLLKSVAD